jgi:hypothetical protein
MGVRVRRAQYFVVGQIRSPIGCYAGPAAITAKAAPAREGYGALAARPQNLSD